MLMLFKQYKKYLGSIIIIFGLLIVQAICDLNLPDYTSDIINVGVQQGGINNTNIEVITKENFDNLLLFVDEEDIDFVKSSYEELNPSEKLIKKYPLLESDVLYEQKDLTKEEEEKLINSLEDALLFVTLLKADNETNQVIREQILNNFPLEIQNSNLSIFDILNMLPNKSEVISSMKEELKSNLTDLPESIVNQSIISFIKSEYELIGVDVDRIQTIYIIKSGLKMLSVALISMLATISVGFLASRLAAKISKSLREDVFSKVLSFSQTEMKNYGVSSLITRTTNDVQQVQMLSVMLLRTVFYAPIIGIGGVIKVLNTNTSMAWIIAVSVMALLSLIIVLFSIAIPRFKKLQKLLDKLNLVIRETLTGLPVIRAFSNQKHEEKRFDKANKDLMKTNLFVNRLMSGMMPLMMFIMNATTILIVWKGSYGINDGFMQVGDLLAFIQYTMQIIMAFLMISMLSIMLPRASVSMKRINEILNTKLAIKEVNNPVSFIPCKKGEVEFRNVSFKYPDSKEDVLTDISFVAPSGKTTAFIGSTGSGKSTLINLIPRLFDATSGDILVNGVNIKNVKFNDLQKTIGYVPQKGILFKGTIESNIKYGNKDASDELMEKAARIAQATDFILQKDKGYLSKISQGGTNVSGGQRQRLSIARAIAKNPDIYIFDDSFSALDFKTDSSLRKALNEEIKGSTILIVAQRISTIMNADKIVVLSDGKIVGVGKHKELLNSCAVYRDIAKSQLSKEELEIDEK